MCKQLRYVCKDSCTVYPYIVYVVYVRIVYVYARTTCMCKDSCVHTVQSIQTNFTSHAHSLLSFHLKSILKAILKTTSRPSDRIS